MPAGCFILVRRGQDWNKFLLTRLLGGLAATRWVAYSTDAAGLNFDWALLKLPLGAWRPVVGRPGGRMAPQGVAEQSVNRICEPPRLRTR